VAGRLALGIWPPSARLMPAGERPPFGTGVLSVDDNPKGPCLSPPIWRSMNHSAYPPLAKPFPLHPWTLLSEERPASGPAGQPIDAEWPGSSILSMHQGFLQGTANTPFILALIHPASGPRPRRGAASRADQLWFRRWVPRADQARSQVVRVGLWGASSPVRSAAGHHFAELIPVTSRSP